MRLLKTKLIKNVKGIFRNKSNIDQEALQILRLELLKGKTWRYLRYLHAREALSLISDWNSIVIIGAGYGLAEVALAVEFPSKRFHLTDHINASHTFKHAKRYVKLFNLKNITFGQHDILDTPKEKFDVVYSVEVLEHIKNDTLAAQNMRLAANKYIFCLVPFAEEKVNKDITRREYVFEKFEHYVAGYDVNSLEKLFPKAISINGCYWCNAGLLFRKRLNDMDIAAINNRYDKLLEEAKLDLRKGIQTTDKEALGIWILSDVRN